MLLKKSHLLPFLCLTFLACKNDPKTDTAQAVPKTKAPVVAPVPPDGSSIFTLTEGTVYWESAYTFGNRAHKGTLKVSGGEFWVSQGQILSGNVSLDMNSISATDLKDPRSRLDLESHLKNSDFFETNNFPKAEFLFTEVSPGNTPEFNWVLNGDLTMKGITAPVSIPFKASIEGDLLRAESANISLNRTTWGVNYRSGILGTTKDKMIDDKMKISLKVVAKRK